MCCAMMECHFVTVVVLQLGEVAKVELHLTRALVLEKASGEYTLGIVCDFPADSFERRWGEDFIETYHERRTGELT